jgi:hypothetical protein
MPPLGAGAHAIYLYYYGIPDNRLYNAIATGAPKWRAKSLERLRFGPLNRNTFSIEILDHYSDYIFSRYFLYELVVTMALYLKKIYWGNY